MCVCVCFFLSRSSRIEYITKSSICWTSHKYASVFVRNAFRPLLQNCKSPSLSIILRWSSSFLSFSLSPEMFTRNFVEHSRKRKSGSDVVVVVVDVVLFHRWMHHTYDAWTFDVLKQVLLTFYAVLYMYVCACASVVLLLKRTKTLKRRKTTTTTAAARRTQFSRANGPPVMSSMRDLSSLPFSFFNATRHTKAFGQKLPFLHFLHSPIVRQQKRLLLLLFLLFLLVFLFSGRRDER